MPQIELSDAELSCLRVTLQDYICKWIKRLSTKDIQDVFKLYIKLGGYKEFFSPHDLAILKNKEEVPF